MGLKSSGIVLIFYVKTIIVLKSLELRDASRAWSVWEKRHFEIGMVHYFQLRFSASMTIS